MADRPINLASTTRDLSVFDDPDLAEILGETDDLLDDDLKAARDYVRRSISDGTWSVYGRAFADFENWCLEKSVEALPASPKTLAAYLAAGAERGLKPNTLEVRAAAIAAAHLAAGHLTPTQTALVSRTLSGIRRVKGSKLEKRTPLVAKDIIRVVDDISESYGLIGLRDRAILLLGFATAMRRSELAALKVEHLEFVEEGLLVTIPRSKGDQEGKGQRIAVTHGTHHCPVAALKTWLSEAAILEGPVFRPFTRGQRLLDRGLSDKQIARIIKQRAERAGFDPALFSGHSLRSGFLTSAAASRASVWKMAEVSRHKSISILREYVQTTELFDDHAGEGLL